VEPSFKKYLYGHVRSNFLRIDFDEFDLHLKRLVKAKFGKKVEE
jgi:hypothetical protein